MDLMLFTVCHVTEIFLKEESGFSRDSAASALLLFHAELLGILVCFRRICAAALGSSMGLEKPRPFLIPTFPV